MFISINFEFVSSYELKLLMFLLEVRKYGWFRHPTVKDISAFWANICLRTKEGKVFVLKLYIFLLQLQNVASFSMFVNHLVNLS